MKAKIEKIIMDWLTSKSYKQCNSSGAKIDEYRFKLIAEKSAEEIMKMLSNEPTIEDLKCCGNCDNYLDNNHCFWTDNERYANDVCGKWQFDGMTKEEREE